MRFINRLRSLLAPTAPDPSGASPAEAESIWDPSQEHIARKLRSEARLRAEGVPFILHLPGIETEDEAAIRGVEEVARRAMALLVVAAKGVIFDQGLAEAMVAYLGVRDDFTPDERAFLWGAATTEQDRVNAAYRFESAWVLLWALGYVPELDRPDRPCDGQAALAFPRERGAERFIADARLRPAGELLDAADLAYRYSWATTDARIKGREAPAGLDPGVVYERHYALNWLIGYMGQDWDDVSTDT